MDDKNRLMSFLIRLLAVRRPRDYVIKPALWILFVHVVATLSMALVQPNDPRAQLPLFIIVVLSSLPFCILVFSVITYLDVLQKKLAQLATTDVLTGLPNRRAFLERAASRSRSSESGMVVIIDADHFKRINDTYGHAVGDLCLQAIADQLRTITRDSDVLGRLGGEEFAVYFSGMESKNALALANRLTATMLVEPPDTETVVSFTLSVGAAATAAAEGIEFYLKRADEALYMAKNAGRAQLVVWPDWPRAEQATNG